MVGKVPKPDSLWVDSLAVAQLLSLTHCMRIDARNRVLWSLQTIRTAMLWRLLARRKGW